MPIALRTDFDAASVRKAARQSKDGAQTRRLLALAAIYDGASRTESAQIGKTVCPPLRAGWLALHCASEGCSGGPSRSSSQESEPWIIIQKFSSGSMWRRAPVPLATC